ncbi:MAG: CCA tRNA nucleotidyltransferase [Chloroflexi bacterium]|nr:CCA tRNA nucleotidyltransferase [Chloroflexota bacterium]
MSGVVPRQPVRPLIWPDIVLDLAESLADYPEPIYVVGGAVRDAYFGLPVKDLDLVTHRGATRLARLIANTLHGDVYVMDAERDVARVLLERPEGRLNIDVAALRADDLQGDLRERDFTINAMASPLQGDMTLLIDPMDGETDLRQKLIRRCSEQSLTSDPLRTLRAVRLSLQLNGHIERETLADMRRHAGALSTVSPERLRDEAVRVLAGIKPYAAMRIMSAVGLLPAVLPEVSVLSSADRDMVFSVVERLDQILIAISPQRSDNTAAAFGLGAFVVSLDRFRAALQAHISVQWANERPHRALLMIAAALACSMSDAPSVVEPMCERLRLSNPERARLTAVLRADRTLVTDLERPLDDLMLHRYWYGPRDAGVDAVLIALAEELGRAGVALDQDRWVHVLERAQVMLEAFFVRSAEVVEPPAVIDGHTLMATLDLRPGAVVGRLLTAIREAQVVGRVHDAESALAVAREVLGS